MIHVVIAWLLTLAGGALVGYFFGRREMRQSIIFAAMDKTPIVIGRMSRDNHGAAYISRKFKVVEVTNPERDIRFETRGGA